MINYYSISLINLYNVFYFLLKHNHKFLYFFQLF